MTDTARVFPSLPAVCGKKVSAAFDGGRITSDGGVLLLASTQGRGICERLATLVPDDRDPTRTRHDVADMFLARSLAIAAGYEDADDLDDLRHDPAFKMALGKAPGAKIGLVSQPTMSLLSSFASKRLPGSGWENNVDLRCAIKMANAMIDVFCESYELPPASITLDIDETFDAAHGEQQLAFWNGFYGERGFLPIHVYETETGRPVAFVLRTAKTPSGKELRAHVRRLIRRIRSHWPQTLILLRGDGHYSRPEVMAWCEAQESLDYLFGLPSNTALRNDPVVSRAKDACAVHRAKGALPVLRTHCETRYAAASWDKADRRVIARIEATGTYGMDVRYIVTSLTGSTPEHLYEKDYCARGQAENLIKLHKTQLKSDRTSCCAALANQMRLILHTVAYWMLWDVQNAMPKAAGLKRAEFATIQRRLVKLGARVIETATRIRIAFASACPDKALFSAVLEKLLRRSAALAQAP